jgi:hypothetical protein
VIGTVLDSEDNVGVAAIELCLLMAACPDQERGWHYCHSLCELVDVQCIDSQGRNCLDG